MKHFPISCTRHLKFTSALLNRNCLAQTSPLHIMQERYSSINGNIDVCLMKLVVSFHVTYISPHDFLFQVMYQSDQFLDKNKDYVVPEHQDLLSASKCQFVADLFPPLPEASKSSKFSSIGSRFKVVIPSFYGDMTLSTKKNLCLQSCASF